MWKRNLLFVGLLVGGVFALGASLMPPRVPKPKTHYNAAAYAADDFRASVAAVDDAFRTRWQASQFRPAPDADALLVARRLSLALMGTVPSLEEIRQFEYLPADQRLAWWTDHVLQDRRFADYMAERLARSYVGTEDGPFILYRRRRFVGWLAERLAKNQPYDQLVRDIITAKGLWTNEPATNFLSVAIKQGVEGSNNQPDPVRLAGRVTRAFLGLRIDCAECHNHPFAPWKQSDFQGMSAFFGQTHIGFTGVYDGTGEYEVVIDPKTKETRTVAPKVPALPKATDLRLPEEGTRREQLAGWVTSPHNPYFARAIVNRVWALMLGRPLREPVDDLLSENPAHPALAVLAKDFAAHGFDLKRLIRVIASSTAFRRDSALDEGEAGEAEVAGWAVFPLTLLRPEQLSGSIIQASSIVTINNDSHFFVRIAKFGNMNDFIQRHGDSGEDELGERTATIPQSLLLMNGTVTNERIKATLFTASARIAQQAPNDKACVEAAYLTLLTRRPSPAEAELCQRELAVPGTDRAKFLEDLFWSLICSLEFSCHH